MKGIFRSAALLAVCFICLLLSACDNRVYDFEVTGYQSNCEEHGGLLYINNLNRAGMCKDGSIVEYYVDAKKE